MENDLLECSKKLLTKGYTGIVVSDSNGLPVFGKIVCLMQHVLHHERYSWIRASRKIHTLLLASHSHATVKGSCVSNSLGASGFSSSLVPTSLVPFDRVMNVCLSYINLAVSARCWAGYRPMCCHCGM